jgi:heat shock protein HslJ
MRSSLTMDRVGTPSIAIAIAVAVVAAGCMNVSTRRHGDAYTSDGPAPGYSGAAGPADFASILNRDWIFVEIAGFDGPLPSPPPIAGFILTPQNRMMRGTTACNAMSSGYELEEPGGQIRFTKLRNNRFLCDRIAADTEEAVLQAMIAADSFQVSGDTLVLYKRGEFVARLRSPD